MIRFGRPGFIIRTRAENVVLVLSDNIKRKAGIPPHSLVFVYIVNPGEPAIFEDRTVAKFEKAIGCFKDFLVGWISAGPLFGSTPRIRFLREGEGYYN